MDCWIVALRGVEDALVEARAVFGAPVAWLGSVEIFQFETADPATAAQAIARIAESADVVSGAVVLEGDDPNGARERAVALACAAAAGEVLFDAATRTRLERELLFVRPETRDGWKLPLVSVALAPAPARRADCRDAVTDLGQRPVLVARDRPVSALLAAVDPKQGAAPILVRAALGLGGGRVIDEAAKRAGKTVWRVPLSALEDADGLWRAVNAAKGFDWIVADPVNASAAPLMPRLASRLATTHQLILRAAPDVPLEFVDAGRTLTLQPLKEYDARAIVRSMLGDDTGEAIVKRLARRAGGSPRRIVETVREAVQSGEIKRDGAAWVRRERRVLPIRGAPSDPVAARIADLPPLLGRAMAVIAAVGDGAREIEVRAALRGTVTPTPDQCIAPIAALGLIEVHGERVEVSASVCALFRTEHPRVLSLFRAGSLETAARAEALLRAGKLRDAGELFAQAAVTALAADLRVAAVRYLAAAVPTDGRADTLSEAVGAAMRSVASAVAPAVVIEPLNANGTVVGRGRTFDPAALEATAVQLSERNDVDGAARLRALAELARGNSQRALRLTGHVSSSDGSSKAQLVAALAQASAGELHRAIRSALTALAIARRTSSSGGEIAALALLSSFYRAAGRDDEAKSLADGARKLQPAPAA